MTIWLQALYLLTLFSTAAFAAGQRESLEVRRLPNNPIIRPEMLLVAED